MAVETKTKRPKRDAQSYRAARRALAKSVGFDWRALPRQADKRGAQRVIIPRDMVERARREM